MYFSFSFFPWFVQKMEHFYIITPIISFFWPGGKTLCGVMEREKELNSRVFFEWPRYVLLCGLYQELNIGLD